MQQALPLEGVLRGYRLAGKALWDHLVATARSGDAPVGDALLDGASEVWRVIDLFCTAAAEAYRLEEGQLREQDGRVQAAVLAALMEGRGSDPRFARDATHALGVPVGGPFVCVVGLAASPDELALEHPVNVCAWHGSPRPGRPSPAPTSGSSPSDNDQPTRYAESSAQQSGPGRG